MWHNQAESLKKEEHSQHEQHGEMAKEYQDPEKTVKVSTRRVTAKAQEKNVLSYCCNSTLNCLFLTKWVN